MRIISGLFKGKKILEPKDKTTRPLKDLTKESIFNIIIHSNKFSLDIKNSSVLDLYSGTGSFGLECLSRGFKDVVFVENYLGVLPILKKNLSSLKNINNYKIIEKDIYKENVFINLNQKFDVIFLDPPYKHKDLENIFNKMKVSNILDSKGIIILHRHKKENDKFLSKFKLIEEKNYGISKIIFLTF